MAISHVGSAGYEFAGAANNQIRATMPSGIATGDLLLVAFGNVGNPGGSTSSPASGWTVIEEDTSGTNAYFIVLGKIAGSTEVAAAGTDIQIATYPSTSGMTVKASRTVAYRGTKTSVATAVVASNFTHESAPADATINTGSASATEASAQWYVAFFAAADSGDSSAATWTADAGTQRGTIGQSSISDGSTTAAVTAFDSAADIAVAAHSRNGTWSATPTRLNAAIVIIDEEDAGGGSTPSNDTYEVYIDWDNDGSVASGSFETNENVSANVLGTKQPLSWAYGRDTARSLSEIEPAEMELKLNNRSRIYSPDNSSSALFGNLGPGKPTLVRAGFNSTNYNLFWGYLSTWNIDPNADEKCVNLSVIDGMAKIAETKVTTEVFPSLQTGQAIEAVLDAAGWSATKRDIDHGASTLRWFWVENESAFQVIQQIVKAEGGPAICYIDPSTGNFTFRDRHHRATNTASKTSQATWRDTGTEPLFSAPVEYDIGFHDLINEVTFEVEERAATTIQPVWTSEDTIIVPSGSPLRLSVQPSDPFIDAHTPEEDVDFTVTSGAITSVSLTRTSGQSTEIVFTASSTAHVQGLTLRATPVPVQRAYTVSDSSSTSITKYGTASYDGETPPWVGRHDAEAVAQTIVDLRAERLPVISVTMKNANSTRKTQIFERDISDRVTIVEAHTGTNHDHFIERIEHHIEKVGKVHNVTFGCERATTVTGLLILGSATVGERLNEGELAT